MEPLASIVGTFALGMAADTGHFDSLSAGAVVKARSSMSEQPGPQGTPKVILGPTALESYYEAKLKTDGIPNPFIKP